MDKATKVGREAWRSCAEQHRHGWAYMTPGLRRCVIDSAVLAMATERGHWTGAELDDARRAAWAAASVTLDVVQDGDSTP